MNIYTTQGQIDLRKALNKLTIVNPDKPKKICKNHIFSYWNPVYPRCNQGNKFNQKCEELPQESEVKNERKYTR